MFGLRFVTRPLLAVISCWHPCPNLKAKGHTLSAVYSLYSKLPSVSEFYLFHRAKIFVSIPPNVVIEWLKHLLRIRKVPVSNLVPETGYTEFFVIFPVPAGTFQDSTLNKATIASFHILSNSVITPLFYFM
jgi:hypothetical protein